MKAQWFWPFLRIDDAELASVFAQGGDELVVQTIDRVGAPAAVKTDHLELRRDLRDIGPFRSPTPRWLLDRTLTYRQRRLARRQLFDHDFDITHIWYTNRFTDPWAITSLAARRPLVVNVHDVFPHSTRLPAGIEQRMLARIYDSGATLIVHHQTLADRLIGQFGVDPGALKIVPHMVRSRAAVSTGARSGNHAVFFGTFRSNKGLDVLMKAIDDVGTDVQWTIAGRGEPSIEQAVREFGASRPNVTTIVERVSDEHKAVLYESADLVVLPYTAFESQSGVLHDAYAHALPVVVTNVGALGDTVREDRTGAVVDPDDHHQLAAAIQAALSDSDSWQNQSDAAAAIAAERSPESIAQQLKAVYRDLLAAHKI